jgi:hypothetical protein
VNPGLRILVDGDAVHLEIDTSSAAPRRELGAVAWSVLELLALVGEDVDGRWLATTNARDVASRLGIGKDRAAGALSALRQAGLLVAHTSRDASSARFDVGCYEVRLQRAGDGNAYEPQRPAPRQDRTRARGATSNETLDLFSATQ